MRLFISLLKYDDLILGKVTLKGFKMMHLYQLPDYLLTSAGSLTIEGVD